MSLDIIRVYNEDLVEKLNVAVGMMLGEAGGKKMRPLNMLEIQRLLKDGKISDDPHYSEGFMSSSWYQQRIGKKVVIHGVMPTYGAIEGYVDDLKMGCFGTDKFGNLITGLDETKLTQGWVGANGVVISRFSSGDDKIDVLSFEQAEQQVLDRKGEPYIIEFPENRESIGVSKGSDSFVLTQSGYPQSYLSRKAKAFSNVYFPPQKLSCAGADMYNKNLEGEILMVPSDATTYDVLTKGEL